MEINTKKVIFLDYLPLTQKTIEDFGLSCLNNEEFEVEYWNLQQIFFKKTVILDDLKDTKGIKVLNINNYCDLKKLIKDNANAIFIILMTFDGRMLRLLFYLNKFNCVSVTYNLISIPFHELRWKKTFLEKIYNLKLTSVFLKIKLYLILFLIKKQYINFYDYILISGSLGSMYLELYFKNNKRIKSKTKLLSFNTTDYNIYLNNKNIKTGSIPNYPYILFIDQYYPFHPDVLLFDNKSLLDANEYYTQLNNSFKIFEEKYSMPVIIAAHPKAIKYKDKNYFDNRTVIFNNTFDLVKNSQFVITHDSTALNYAIFCNKPIVLFNSNLIKIALPNNYYNIVNLTKYLYTYIYNMDDIYSWNLPKHIQLSEEQIRLFPSLIIQYHKALNTSMSNEKLLINYVRQIFDNKDSRINKTI